MYDQGEQFGLEMRIILARGVRLFASQRALRVAWIFAVERRALAVVCRCVCLLPSLHCPFVSMSHEERFIPERQKLDQLSVIKDYAAVPRLEYR